MNSRTRLLIVLGPLLISLTAAFALVYPTFLEWQAAKDELAKQEDELRDLQGKLAEKAGLASNHKSLEADINGLRNEVPRAPYLDLLMLDLERMANAAGVDIISVEKLEEKSNAAAADGADLEVLNSAGALVKDNKLLDKNKVQDKDKKTDAANSMGVKQITRRLYLTGNYSALITFMKRLESYQRVLSVKELDVAIGARPDGQSQSPASQKAQKLKLTQPVLSFLLNVYYLP